MRCHKMAEWCKFNGVKTGGIENWYEDGMLANEWAVENALLQEVLFQTKGLRVVLDFIDHFDLEVATMMRLNF